MPASVRPRRTSDGRRGRLVAGIALAAVVVYVGVVALYAAGEASRISAPCEPAPDEAVVDIVPQSVDAARDRIAVTVAIAAPGPLAVNGLGYLDPVTVVVDGSDADRSFTIPAQTIPGAFAVSLLADGEIEQWPFDVHTATARIAIVQTVDGVVAGAIPSVCAQGQVAGWTLTATTREGDDELGVNDQPVPEIVLTATRSPATVVFGIVLLALLVTLPVLSLTVAVVAYRGRRKVEATLMSWMAAMLFATVPLRGFLPGSPPVGSWVDYLVVLWVVAGLVAGLVVYVLAWLRWAPAAGERPVR